MPAEAQDFGLPRPVRNAPCESLLTGFAHDEIKMLLVPPIGTLFYLIKECHREVSWPSSTTAFSLLAADTPLTHIRILSQ